MRFLLFLFAAVFINAKIVSLVDVKGDRGEVNESVKRGVSGYVICPFDNQEIICARAVFYGKSVKFKAFDELQNRAFALPVVRPKKDDKIILNPYKRAVIIAPNQELYLKVKDYFSNKTLIHPDVLYVYLEGEVSKKGLINFAKDMNIDEYIFVLDRVYEVDANSFFAINSFDKFGTKSYNTLFFNSYSQKKSKNMLKEYKRMIKGIK
jgi:hypothetical protein